MDIKSLMKELETAQNTDVSHKLSERSVVELINKLTERKMIEVLTTRSGLREYLTWPELEKEILEEVDAHDGRMSFSELESAINIDITYIEKCAQKLCDSHCGIMKLSNQEIINDLYTQIIVEKCTDIIISKGIMKIGLLATKFNIPVSYLTTSVIPMIHSYSPQIEVKNGELYTIGYIRRIQSRIRGLLYALEKPAILSELSDNHSIDSSLLQETIASLIKSSQLSGAIKGGSFVPQRYENEKNNAVISFLRTNQYVTKKMLKENRISSPHDYFSKQGYSSPLYELETVWISKDLHDDVSSTLVELCNEESYVEMTTVFPSCFSTQDQIDVLKKNETISFEFNETVTAMYVVVGEYLVQLALMRDVIEHFVVNAEMQITKVSDCIPSNDMITKYIHDHYTSVVDDCITVLLPLLYLSINTRYELCYKKQKMEMMKGESSHRKIGQKEIAVILGEFYHHYESINKLLETVQDLSMLTVLTHLEKKMKIQGICSIIHFLQVLNDCPVTPLTDLQNLSIPALREEVKKLGNDVQEFISELLGLVNGPKKAKVIIKTKPKPKGKAKKEEEEEKEEEEKPITFIDCYVNITDFGGPLFKPYDRKQLRQLLFSGKMEMQQKLKMTILQSVDENTILLLASLMMNLKFNVIPYVPSIEVAKSVMLDYVELIPEESKDSYKEKVLTIFDEEKKDELQSCMMDLIDLIVKKD